MATDREIERPTIDPVLMLLNDQSNAELLSQAQRIFEQGEAIRQLEAITRQVDAPYIGSYLSA